MGGAVSFCHKQVSVQAKIMSTVALSVPKLPPYGVTAGDGPHASKSAIQLTQASSPFIKRRTIKEQDKPTTSTYALPVRTTKVVGSSSLEVEMELYETDSRHSLLITDGVGRVNIEVS